jgi:hypothetical protein
MNLERGFRRIVLLLSIIAGLSIGSFEAYKCYEDHLFYLSSCKEHYQTEARRLDDILWFWSVWDCNGWSGGKRVVLKDLLDPEYSKECFVRDCNGWRCPGGIERYLPIKLVAKNVSFTRFDVFPGLDYSVVNLPPDILDKTAQQAKNEAIDTIRRELLSSEKKLERVEKINTYQIVTNSLITSLSFGILAFISIWAMFFLVRWLILGFIDEKRKI